MRTFRASLKTLIGSFRKSGLAAYTRNPLVNGLVFRGALKFNNAFTNESAVKFDIRIALFIPDHDASNNDSII